MASSKSDKDERVFDVAKPGKTAASASSRPLIIGHKSILKDPMVKESAVLEIGGTGDTKSLELPEEDVPTGSPVVEGEGTADETAEEIVESPSNSKLKIKPLSSKRKKEDKPDKDTAKTAAVSTKATKASKVKIITDNDDAEAEETAAETDAVEVDLPKDEEAQDEAKPEEESEKPEETPTEESAKTVGEALDEASNDKTEDEEVAEEPTEEKPAEETDEKEESSEKSQDESSSSDDSASPAAVEAQKKQDKAEQAATARKEELEKEISGGEYFVPIGEKTRKKRSMRHILVGTFLILLLGAALVYLMIDVGIIKANINLPYHFFKQQNIDNDTSAPDSTSANEKSTTAKPTTTTYTSKIDKFSFVYPADWAYINNVTDTKNEYLNVRPKSETGDEAVFYEIQYARKTGPIVKSDNTYKITYIKYSDTDITVNGRKLYLKEIILLNNKTPQYSASSGLTDVKGTEKVGDNIPGNQLYPDFLSIDDKTRVQFFELMLIKPGTQISADYFSSSEYLPYKKVLTSASYSK